MSIYLSFKHLHLAFGEKIIFDDAELTLNKGDRIGLIGLNGQGKSTLFNIIDKKVKPDISKPPFLLNESNEAFKVFHIPQELNIDDFKDLTIEYFFLSFYPELLKVHQKLIEDYSNQELLEKFERLGGWDIQNSYLSYLKGFDLEDVDRSLEGLSGGEQRKVALSIGLSSTAQILLWDEPTNHLDIETIERFEDELLNCNKTYLIISHDRYFLNHTTNKICHIERGKITSFNGTYLDYLEHLEMKEAELKKNLDKLENKKRRELAWMRQGVKARRTRSKKRVEGFHDINSKISDIKSKVRNKAKLELSHSDRKTKILVQVKEASFSYPDKEIFKELDFLITKKDKIALIGPNGAGKSTLVSIISEKLKVSSGTQKNALDLKVVVFDQKRESLDLNATPKEIIGEGNDTITLGDGRQKHINSYLTDFLFTSDQVNRPVSTLSGGEKNRLQLAKFMKQSADIWIFDEPTNDLDIETIELLEKELKSYKSAVIIIGHDRAFLDNTCKTTWLINDMKIEKFDGGYTQIAPYLHALESKKENEKQVKAKVKPSTAKKVESTSKKISSEKCNKKELGEIEQKISELEDLISKIDSKLSDIDYGNMTKVEKEKLSELNGVKASCDTKLQDLYSKWEELSNT